MDEAKMPTGKTVPVMYRDEIGRELTERMSTGETVTSILKDKHMPDVKLLWRWRLAHPDLDAMYKQAREEQMHAWADDIVGIVESAYAANTVTVPITDLTEVSRDKKAKTVTLRLDRPFLAQAKEAVKVRQWLMARVMPHFYGDKLQLTSADNFDQKDDRELIQRMRDALDAAEITPAQFCAMLEEGADEGATQH